MAGASWSWITNVNTERLGEPESRVPTTHEDTGVLHHGGVSAYGAKTQPVIFRSGK